MKNYFDSLEFPKKLIIAFVGVSAVAIIANRIRHAQKRSRKASKASLQRRLRMQMSMLETMEDRLLARQQGSGILPVVLVTGFLGSGKTTLLRRILQTQGLQFKIGALVNDFASLNVDSELVKMDAEEDTVVELSNGCICCSLGDDLRGAMYKAMRGGSGIGSCDYLIVETSGVTDPTAVVLDLEKAALESGGAGRTLRLDAVITVVDAEQVSTNLAADENAQTQLIRSTAFASQLRCADIILLNKVSLISSEREIDRVEKFVNVGAPDARIILCNYCDVPLPNVLHVKTVEPQREAFGRLMQGKARLEKSMFVIGSSTSVPSQLVCSVSRLETSESLSNRRKNRAAANGKGGHSAHDGLPFVSMSYIKKKPFSFSRFQKLIDTEVPSGVVRMKGIVYFQEEGSKLRDRKYVFQISGCGKRRRCELVEEGSWVTAPSVGLVLIGQNDGNGRLDVEKKKKKLDLCIVEGHHHHHHHREEEEHECEDTNDGNDRECMDPECTDDACNHYHKSHHQKSHHHQPHKNHDHSKHENLSFSCIDFLRDCMVNDKKGRFIISPSSNEKDQRLLTFSLSAKKQTGGKSVDELDMKYGVDMKTAQKHFARRVNAHAFPLLVATVPSADMESCGIECVCAPIFTLHVRSAEESWKMLCKEADLVLTNLLSQVPNCECGY
eukprot:g1058.t1